MDKLDAVLARIDQQEEPEVPEGIQALELLQLVYRGKVKLTPQQARAAIEALPYENPKLSATAHVNFNYADQLEKELKAIERSKQPPLLNAPAEELPAEELKQPMARLRRF